MTSEPQEPLAALQVVDQILRDLNFDEKQNAWLDRDALVSLAEGLLMSPEDWRRLHAKNEPSVGPFEKAASSLTMDDYGVIVARLFDVTLDEGYAERMIPWLDEHEREVLGYRVAQVDQPALLANYGSMLPPAAAPNIMAHILARAIHHEEEPVVLKRIWDSQPANEGQIQGALMGWLTMSDRDEEEEPWGPADPERLQQVYRAVTLCPDLRPDLWAESPEWDALWTAHTRSTDLMKQPVPDQPRRPRRRRS